MMKATQIHFGIGLFMLAILGGSPASGRTESPEGDTTDDTIGEPFAQRGFYREGLCAIFDKRAPRA